MSLLPLYPFLIALLVVLFIVLYGLLEDKFYRVPFVVYVINAIGFLVYIFIFNQFSKETWFLYTYYGHFSFSVLSLVAVLYIYFRKIVFFKLHYHIFLRSMKDTRWNSYYVVDHKGRIKEMSDGVIEELGLKKEDIIGKPLFEVFNKTIRINTFDEVETNNQSLSTYYEDYVKTVKPNQIDHHTMHFQNYQGKSVLMYTVEQPIFIMGKYRGRINIGEKKSDFDLIGIEKELTNTQKELESLRQKYIATLELSEEGLYYIDLDERYIWLSETAMKMTNIPSSMIPSEDFHKYIFPDDLNAYLGTLSSLTVRKQTFKTKYRFMKNGQYVWVDDKGKRIFEDQTSNIILGSLKLYENTGYERLGIDVVDTLKNENDIHYHLDKLTKENRTFQLALFELSNIPEINKTYGRNIGNMLIGEYVKKLKTSFVSESSEVFRLSGLVFAVTIIDPRKMELLRTGVLNDPEFLNLPMTYGAIKTKMEVVLGVSSSYKDSDDPKELYELAHKALSVARHEDFKLNVCYYSDLNG